MSALEEVRTDGSGKDIRGRRPVVDGVHPAPIPPPPVYPHVAYGRAVYADLVSEDLRPAVFEVGLSESDTGGRELFLRLVWPPHHPRLGVKAQESGLVLRWSHVHGWSAHDLDATSGLLDVEVLAEPLLVTDVALHLAEHGLGCEWVPPFLARWEEAPALDAALAAWADREVTR